MRINFIVGGEIMVQAILEIFTSEEKATAMLANPIIEFIFMVLMITFVITLFVHVALFVRLRKTRNYLKKRTAWILNRYNLFKNNLISWNTEKVLMLKPLSKKDSRAGGCFIYLLLI